jgi:hypothetical protein
VVPPRRQTAPAPATDTAIPAETARSTPSIQLPRANVPVPQPPPAEPNPVQAPAIPDSTLISSAVASYARAIEAGDLAAIRRIYPSITPQQQQSFEQFFEATSDLRVTFRMTNVSINGSTADARVTGEYAWQTTRGPQRQPVDFSATLRKDGDAWRFVSVR